MAIQSYEILLLLDPTKTATDFEGMKEQIHATMNKYGAEVLVSRKWYDGKLAYAINKQKRGHYHLIFAKVDSLKINKIDHDFRVSLSETIMRHMITLVHPKWHEEIFAVAQDENAMAVKIFREEPSEGGPGEGAEGAEGVPAYDEDRPRRGRRDDYGDR